MADGLPIWDVHAHYLPEGALQQMAYGPATVKVETVDGIDMSITVNGMPVGATVQQLSDPTYLVAKTDKAGIDRRVMSPPPFTYRYWDDAEASVGLHRYLNDATAALVEAHPDRFVGLATVPLQDAGVAVEELRRARGELGLAGVTLGTNVAGGDIADEVRRPLLAAAADTGMPVLVHPDFVPNPRWSSHYLINLIGMPVDTAIAMGNLIFSGRLAEFSDLRICFLHGGGAAPYLFGRWDRGWQVRVETKDDIDRQPTSFLQGVFCDTLTHSPTALSYLVETLGADHVVLGTDLPFDVEDADPLGSLDSAPRLTEEERQAIRSTSPVRWLYAGQPPS
ncbi:MAG TPA: amidohydrolase family protein [Acidimicrobiia bacterium]|nr:amidohydrolase family protein [Acidimicrobiia bacterium]